MRWAWNGLTAGSVLLCIAALAAWPATLRHGFGLRASHSGPAGPAVQVSQGIIVEVGAGVACVRGGDEQDGPARLWGSAGLHGGLLTVDQKPRLPFWLNASAGPVVQVADFGAGAGVTTMERGTVVFRDAALLAPLWAWALAFGLLPAFRALAWYRRRGRWGGPAFEVVRRKG